MFVFSAFLEPNWSSTRTWGHARFESFFSSMNMTFLFTPFSNRASQKEKRSHHGSGACITLPTFSHLSTWQLSQSNASRGWYWYSRSYGYMYTCTSLHVYFFLLKYQWRSYIFPPTRYVVSILSHGCNKGHIDSQAHFLRHSDHLTTIVLFIIGAVNAVAIAFYWQWTEDVNGSWGGE